MKNIPYSKNMRWDPKIPVTVKKKLFKIFVQAWNFIPLQSIPPVIGCSDPSTAPTAGNIV